MCTSLKPAVETARGCPAAQGTSVMWESLVRWTAQAPSGDRSVAVPSPRRIGSCPARARYVVPSSEEVCWIRKERPSAADRGDPGVLRPGEVARRRVTREPSPGLRAVGLARGEHSSRRVRVSKSRRLPGARATTRSAAPAETARTSPAHSCVPAVEPDLASIGRPREPARDEPGAGESSRPSRAVDAHDLRVRTAPAPPPAWRPRRARGEAWREQAPHAGCPVHDAPDRPLELGAPIHPAHDRQIVVAAPVGGRDLSRDLPHRTAPQRHAGEGPVQQDHRHLAAGDRDEGAVLHLASRRVGRVEAPGVHRRSAPVPGGAVGDRLPVGGEASRGHGASARRSPGDRRGAESEPAAPAIGGARPRR